MAHHNAANLVDAQQQAQLLLSGEPRIMFNLRDLDFKRDTSFVGGTRIVLANLTCGTYVILVLTPMGSLVEKISVTADTTISYDEHVDSPNVLVSIVKGIDEELLVLRLPCDRTHDALSLVANVVSMRTELQQWIAGVQNRMGKVISGMRMRAQAELESIAISDDEDGE